MIPTIGTIKAELASAQERLKFVDDSIGRSKRVGYQDSGKNGSFQQHKRIKGEEGEIIASESEKIYTQHSSANESDLRKRLSGKRVVPSFTDLSGKRQKRYSDLSDELPPVIESRRAKYGESDDSGRTSNRNLKNRDLPDVRPRLTSRVIPPQDDRTRDDVVKMQGQNKAVKERNRRIFGALLGTLSKFQKEETSIHKEQENRRAEAEKRIEEKEEKERQMLKLKREELIIEKKIQEFQVIHLQRKMERVRQFEEWMKNTELLKKFVCTRKKPKIYYLPKILTENSKERLKQSIDEVQDEIKDRQNKLEEELLQMDEAFRVKCEYLKKPRISVEDKTMEYYAEPVNDQETNVENTWETTEENLNRGIETLEPPVSPKVGESPHFYENEGEDNVIEKVVTEEVSKKHQEEISGNEKGGRGKHNSDVESPESPNSQNDVISPMSPDYSSILHKKNPSEMIKAD